MVSTERIDSYLLRFLLMQLLLLQYFDVKLLN